MVNVAGEVPVDGSVEETRDAPRPLTDAAAGAPPSPRDRSPGASAVPHFHEAVELVGKRWTGAILYVLLQGGRLRFSEIGQAVPDLSDRLLSERMKELEARGIVERHVSAEPPVTRRVRADRRWAASSRPRWPS